MKSRQVGFVLMALIAVGVAGLVFRVVSSGSEAVILEGLVQVSQEASDRIVICHPGSCPGDDADAERDGSRTEIKRLGQGEQARWSVDGNPVFDPIMRQFWQAVEEDLYDAQLVSNNPKNHERMGVAEGQAIEVSFFIGGQSLQEKFFVGTWKPDVRLCYVRRAGHNETYGIPCPGGNIFEPDPDRWKNPVVAAIPPNEIQQIQFTYLDEAFLLSLDDEGEWNVTSADGTESPANPNALRSIIGTLQLVIASGFADEAEADDLNFAVPDAMVRVITHENATSPSTRLRFLQRDDNSMYVSVPSSTIVFIVDNRVTAPLLLRMAQVSDAPPEG